MTLLLTIDASSDLGVYISAATCQLRSSVLLSETRFSGNVDHTVCEREPVLSVRNAPQCPPEHELLHNGICFSPQALSQRGFSQVIGESISDPPYIKPVEPSTPSYIEDPPKVIAINIGRQLFVDDFLIASTDLDREYHKADDISDPRLKPLDRFRTAYDPTRRTHLRVHASALYNGGIWWDAAACLYRMVFYCRVRLPRGSMRTKTCYSLSSDLETWSKARILPSAPEQREKVSVWLDTTEVDASRRWKMVALDGSGSISKAVHASTVDMMYPLRLYVSADGENWRLDNAVGIIGWAADACGVSRDRFRGTWQLQLKQNYRQSRIWRYWERDELAQAHEFPSIFACEHDSTDINVRFAKCNDDPERSGAPPFWFAADVHDGARYHDKEEFVGWYGNATAQISGPRAADVYQVSTFSYESVTVALFGIHFGGNMWPKLIDTHVGFSRDGVEFTRPPAEQRTSFVNHDSWDVIQKHMQNWTPDAQGWVQTICSGSSVVVEPDTMHFFCFGVPLLPQLTKNLMDTGSPSTEWYAKKFLYKRSELLHYTMRRDGFASMRTPASAISQPPTREYTLVTRPVMWQQATSLWLNVEIPRGASIRVLVRRAGRANFLLTSVPLYHEDSGVRVRVTWAQLEPLLSDLSQQALQFEFRLRAGTAGAPCRLYAFWVSLDDAGGASNGFIPGGGPDAVCGIDTEA